MTTLFICNAYEFLPNYKSKFSGRKRSSLSQEYRITQDRVERVTFIAIHIGGLDMAKNLMRDPATASSRIYVGSLSEQATEAQIQDLFSKYGAIRGVLVSKGYGFVQFETDESAQNAIQNENQQMFLNRKLIVRTAQKNSGGSGGGGGGMGGDNNPRNNPNINKSGNFGGNNNSGPSQQSQPLGSSTGFSIPVFGGGSQPPDRMSRWNPSQNRMSLDKSNDNGRDRSPLGDQRGKRS